MRAQTIALLAWLAATRGSWGPHLVVVPTSVLLNWEMEFKRFAPAFSILTYFGTPRERKAKRAGWSKRNAFHVCITSYNLVLQARRGPARHAPGPWLLAPRVLARQPARRCLAPAHTHV